MIYWVFGGTAVGKKTFIRYAERNPHLLDLPNKVKPVWIHDGDIETDVLVSKKRDTIVRWQWGRERKLLELYDDYPSIKHQMYLLVAHPDDQVKRVLKREGILKWDARRLYGEGREIYGLARGLSAALKIDLKLIDTTKGFRIGDLGEDQRLGDMCELCGFPRPGNRAVDLRSEYADGCYGFEGLGDS